MKQSSLAGRRKLRALLIILLAAMFGLFGLNAALAHAVAEGDKGYIQEITGVNLIPFVYLGA